ncbi:hypothetical protein [Isoptericola sp. NPDC057391]|uniref:hypothetical protein n=1 Tax=Isoptericola sp. NPDC057391 TaxID=3346117 RepID=UPI00362659A9
MALAQPSGLVGDVEMVLAASGEVDKAGDGFLVVVLGEVDLGLDLPDLAVLLDDQLVPAPLAPNRASR